MCSYCKNVLERGGCNITLVSCVNANWLQDFSSSLCTCQEQVPKDATTHEPIEPEPTTIKIQCEDQQAKKWCKKQKKMDHCSKESIANKCMKTCQVC